MEKLDLLDRKMLYELDLDARQNVSRLAKRLHISRERAAFRLKRLIEQGFISSFYTIIDIAKLGCFYYKLYIKFRNVSPEKEDDIFEYVERQKDIVYLARMEGHYDGVAVIMVRTPHDLTLFLYPFMQKFGVYIQEKEIMVFLRTHRLNQRFVFPGERQTDRQYSRQITPSRIDQNDWNILRAITKNARSSMQDISDATNLEPGTCGYRLRRMEQGKVILGYAISVNTQKLGLRFVQINISLLNPTIIDKVIGYFNATQKCLFAAETLGRYDLIVEVYVESDAMLREISDGFKRNFYNQYYDIDISTITKEHIILWIPQK